MAIHSGRSSLRIVKGEFKVKGDFTVLRKVQTAANPLAFAWHNLQRTCTKTIWQFFGRPYTLYIIQYIAQAYRVSAFNAKSRDLMLRLKRAPFCRSLNLANSIVY